MVNIYNLFNEKTYDLGVGDYQVGADVETFIHEGIYYLKFHDVESCNDWAYITMVDLYTDIGLLNPELYYIMWPDKGNRDVVLHKTLQLITDKDYEVLSVNTTLNQVRYTTDQEVHVTSINNYWEDIGCYGLSDSIIQKMTGNEPFTSSLDELITNTSEIIDELSGTVSNIITDAGEAYGEAAGSVISGIGGAASETMAKSLNTVTEGVGVATGLGDMTGIILLAATALVIYMIYDSKEELASTAKSGASVAKSAASLAP